MVPDLRPADLRSSSKKKHVYLVVSPNFHCMQSILQNSLLLLHQWTGQRRPYKKAQTWLLMLPSNHLPCLLLPNMSNPEGKNLLVIIIHLWQGSEHPKLLTSAALDSTAKPRLSVCQKKGWMYNCSQADIYIRAVWSVEALYLYSPALSHSSTGIYPHNFPITHNALTIHRGLPGTGVISQHY